MDGSTRSTLCDRMCPPHSLTSIIREPDRAGLAWQDMLDTLQQIRSKTRENALTLLKQWGENVMRGWELLLN